jgi:FSR family fosmidomycin resistance protein-like MFS transporter
MLTTRVISTRSNLNVRTVAVPALGSAMAIAAVALTHTAVDIAGGSVSALMPTIRHRFHLSAAGIGAMVAAVALCTSMAQPLAGRVADRLGAKRVAATGAVLCSALLSMLGIAGHVWIVVALIVIGGFSSAGYHPASVVMARRVLPDRAQLAVSLFSAGGMLGLAFGPLLVLLIAAHAGIGFTPLLMIPGVLLGGAMWRFLPADPPSVTRDREVTRPRSILRGPVGALTLASALAALAATTFSAGLPLWLTEHAGFDIDSAAIGVTLALFQIGSVAGGLLSGYLSCRVRPSHLCFASLMLAAPSLALALCTEPGGPGFYAAVTAAGALTNAVVPILIVAAQEHSPGAVGLASGMVMGLANGAAGLGFAAIGFLADGQGLRVALLVGFAAVVPAALVARHALAERPTTDSAQLFVIGCGCACSGCSFNPAERDGCCDPKSCCCETLPAVVR